MGRDDIIAGIFVGGRGTRMGGVAKGLLVAPDGERIVVRTLRILDELQIASVLVGAHPAYESLEPIREASGRKRRLELPTILDDSDVEGPLGGLLALLAHAGPRSALAIASDMPLLTRDLVQRLVDAPRAPIVAPRRRIAGTGSAAPERETLEPLFARYDAAAVLPTCLAFARGGGRKLQLLLAACGAQALMISPAEAQALDDWDSPRDLPEEAPRGRRGP